MDELNNPRFLPCHHTFCFLCIEDLRSSHPGRMVPCPLCRSTFNTSADRLRKNDYVEELVKVSRDVKEMEERVIVLKNKLKAVESQLEESEDTRQGTLDDKRRLETELAETRTRLGELEERSSQVEEQLESKVVELEGKLSDAQSRERCIRELQLETMNELRDVERRYEAARVEAEHCRTAKNESDESLAEVKQSCQSLRQEIQETNQQARDAERQKDEARQETESIRMVKNKVEASLEKKKRKCWNLHQELQRIQKQSSEQTEVLRRELGQSKEEIYSLEKQVAMGRMKLEQQEDFRKSHSAGFATFLIYEIGLQYVLSITVHNIVYLMY